MKKVKTNPTTYISSLPDDIQKDVRQLDEKISQLMAGHTRVLWQGTFWGGSEQNIIGYGDITYGRPRGADVEWFIIGLAVQKHYISLYINAVENRQYLAETYAKQLGKVKVGKSSISFKRLENLNMPILTELVQKAKDIASR